MIGDDLSRLAREPAPTGGADEAHPADDAGEAPDRAAPDDGPARPWLRARRPGRWRLWERLSIQSQLLTMLLVVSVASVLVAGTIGYLRGRDSLRDAAFSELTAVREARSDELTRFYETTLDSLVIYTRDATATAATDAFTAGFAALDDTTLAPEQTADLERYYQQVFVPRLAANSDVGYEPDGFVPQANAQRYLQALYTAPFDDDYDAILAIDDAGDGSDWSAAHATYHDHFRELAQRFDYEDILLLDTEGNVVYSVYKGVDLGTNLATGPFSGTNLAEAYERALASNTVDFATVTDFARYQPDFDDPISWALSPIGRDGDITGVLALQVPARSINEIMTGGQDWPAHGLGRTGEVYVAGPDRLMRSVSRELVVDPDGFRDDALDVGVPADRVEEMLSLQDTILLMPADTEAVDRALAGERGTTTASTYLGRDSLVAYAPLPLEELSWVVVAAMDRDEALGAVDRFTRTLGLSTAVIILCICLASLLLAQTFVRPLRRLVTGVRRVAGGDYDIRVDAYSNDEFGDLANAFNDMARSLRTKQELLDDQQRENDRLLLSLMPEALVHRYRQGEETITQDHREVAVVFADLVGFDEFSANLSSAQALGLLNGLTSAYDEVALELGVEKVRDVRNGYLASCGLVTPHIDNARRAVEFAEAMHDIVRRFNAQRGADLSLRAGIDAGTVTSGLVGPSNVVYDMWGDAVNLAYQAQATTGQPGIYVTARVYDRLRDVYRFEPAGTLEISGAEQSVWRVRREGA